MDKNGINIINDLDKENDDLMTHLGDLQQISLGEKTNVLKQIKSYENNNLENIITNNNNNESTNSKNIQSEPKNDINISNINVAEKKPNKNRNKKMFIFNNDKNELDTNEINTEQYNEFFSSEVNNNSELKNFIQNKINDDYKVFKENEKLFLNLKQKNIIENQNEINSNELEFNNQTDINKIKLNINSDIDYNTDNININTEKNINSKIEFSKEENKGFKSDYDIHIDNKFENKMDTNYLNSNITNTEEKEIDILNNNTNEEKKSNIKIINNENKNDNFICDLDIFKKLQIQMNKKSEILQKTIDKYNHKPKKIEIINESKINQNSISNYSNEQNIINDSLKDKTNFNINSTGINIDDINEKMNSNTKNLLEKINKIKSNINRKEISNLSNNKQKEINKDKDMFIKKEIKSAQSSYEPLIFRIPSLLLDDKIEEIEIYIKLEMIYYNLKTITSKLDFISLLRQVLNNVIMLKNSSFNVYLQLFNFILSLQIYELNLSDCSPSLPCEYLKSLLDLLVNNKDLTEMIRIIIVLIKKYFPINMNIILEQKNIVTLKVLNSYLKQLNNIILSAYINIKSVFIEINDFLFFSPPSLLKDEFPLAELYMEIYEEIRNTTDNIIKSCRSKIMKNELMNAVVFIKSKIKNSSVDYVKYLDYAIYKIN